MALLALLSGEYAMDLIQSSRFGILTTRIVMTHPAGTGTHWGAFQKRDGLLKIGIRAEALKRERPGLCHRSFRNVRDMTRQTPVGMRGVKRVVLVDIFREVA